MLVPILAATHAAADIEIHRCPQEDGSVAFQETPCPEPAAKVDDDDEAGETGSDTLTAPANDDFFDFVNPYDEHADPPPPAEPPPPEPVSQDRAECEKITRDAIDAIDLEMRANSYTKEQGEAYLAELLELTRQLRACKQL